MNLRISFHSIRATLAFMVERGGIKMKVVYFLKGVEGPLGNTGGDEYCKKTGIRWKISSTLDVNGNTTITSIEYQSPVIDASTTVARMECNGIRDCVALWMPPGFRYAASGLRRLKHPLKIQNFGMAGWTRRCVTIGAGKPAAPCSRTRGRCPTVSHGQRKEPRSE